MIFSGSGAVSDRVKSFTDLMPIRTSVCTKQILVIYGFGVEDARQTTNPMGWQHVTINWNSLAWRYWEFGITLEKARCTDEGA